MGESCIFGCMLWSYILWMFLAMLGVILGKAFYYSELVNIAFSFKDFSQPYFRLGVQFTKELYLDRKVEVFTLALFFVHLDIDFVQPLSKEEEHVIREQYLDEEIKRIRKEIKEQPFNEKE